MINELYQRIITQIKKENTNTEIGIKREAEMRTLITILECAAAIEPKSKLFVTTAKVQVRFERMLENPQWAGRHTYLELNNI